MTSFIFITLLNNLVIKKYTKFNVKYIAYRLNVHLFYRKANIY